MQLRTLSPHACPWRSHLESCRHTLMTLLLPPRAHQAAPYGAHKFQKCPQTAPIKLIFKHGISLCSHELGQTWGGQVNLSLCLCFSIQTKPQTSSSWPGNAKAQGPWFSRPLQYESCLYYLLFSPLEKSRAFHQCPAGFACRPLMVVNQAEDEPGNKKQRVGDT